MYDQDDLKVKAQCDQIKTLIAQVNQSEDNIDRLNNELNYTISELNISDSKKEQLQDMQKHYAELIANELKEIDKTTQKFEEFDEISKLIQECIKLDTPSEQTSTDSSFFNNNNEKARNSLELSGEEAFSDNE